MATLTRDDVLKLAQLAKLSLSEGEVEELAAEINEILQYVEQLQDVDVSGFEPTYQVTGLMNVMRDDNVKDYGYAPEKLLENVPALEDGLIKVKRILG